MQSIARRRPFRPGGSPSPDQPPGPIPGTAPRELVRDAAGRLGEVMDSSLNGKRVYLRPPNGGREWEVDADSITPVERAQAAA